MEILAALFLLWIFVTLIGHASYVVVRKLFRAITGDQRAVTRAPSPESDILAAERVIAEMAERGLLTKTETEKLRRSLPELAVPVPVPVKQTELSTLPSSLKIPVDVPDTPPATSAVGSVDEPLVAELVSEEPFAPARPVISKAEIIRSFLAANNIRWGELVAGMLIVVCSIGLVISLWNTITEHRIIPSMIFLSANAAIYAAGFYTLRRWRLAHTSRAVLAIATLMVPLTVLAGIAAAGNGPRAVELTDPLTLLAMLVAGSVYGTLLYRGGIALGKRAYAWPLTLSVVGPVAVIPLVPAAVRNMDSDAGWIVGLGSIGIFVALSMTSLMRKHATKSLGGVSGRTRMMVMAFSAFAMSVCVGYAVVAMRHFGQPAMMAIAIATIPALVAVAAAGLSLATDARRSSQSMAGAVVCAVLLGLCWIVLPPATISIAWLWSWGLVLAASMALATWLFRQPRWLAFATLPVGIATTLSSPVWLGGLTWGDVGFWNRCIAGEPMLAAALVGAVIGGLCFVLKSRQWVTSDTQTMGRWLGFSAVFWLSVSLSIAILLTFAPLSFLGIAPWWSVTGVLLAGVAVSAVLANRHQVFAVGTIITTAFAAASVFRPFGTETLLDFAPSPVWLRTLLATSAGLLVVSEVATRINQSKLNSLELWNGAACVAGTTAAIIACRFAASDWSTTAVMLTCVAGLLFWSSTLSRSTVSLMVCQLSTVALSAVIGYGHYRESLFAIDAWKMGTAPFGWAIIGSIVVATWLAIRQLAIATNVPSHGRLRHLRSDHPGIEQTPIGWVSLIATILLASGSAWSFAGLLSSEFGSEAVIFDTNWYVPAIAFAAIGLVMTWIRLQERLEIDTPRNDFFGSLAAVASVSIVAWMANEIACWLAVDPQLRLVLATSLASIAYMFGAWMKELPQRFSWLERVSSVSLMLGPLMIASSSAALLANGWIDPIGSGQYADQFSTLAVATWWIVGAVAFFLRANRRLESVSGLLSSLLAPASAVLVVPVFYQFNPIVWFQVAAIVSAVWWLAAYWLMDREQSQASELAISLSAGFVMIAGIGSAVLALMHTVFNLEEVESTLGFPGVCISMIAIGDWCVIGLRSSRANDSGWTRLPWFAGIALIAGQIGWLSVEFGLVSGIEVVELVSAFWLATSIAALLRHDQNRLAAVHIVAISGLMLIVDADAGMQSDRTPPLAIAGLCSVGCLVAFARWSVNRSVASCIAYRILGWLVVLSGGYLLTSRCGLPQTEEIFWTVIIGWASLWVLLWRTLAARVLTEEPRISAFRLGPIPDMEFAILLGFAALVEAILSASAGIDIYPRNITDPLLIARVISLTLVAASVLFRADRTIAWTTSFVTFLSVVSLVSVQVAIDFGATPGGRYASALLPAAFMIALFSGWIAALARRLSRISGVSGDRIGSCLIESTWHSALTIAGLAALASIAMIANQTTPSEINMTIVAVALSAWAVATIADAGNRSSLRHAAVSLALATIGLWASVNPVDTNYPLLMASMRWLVASVLTIPMALFVFPKLIGTKIALRWRDALTRGAMVAAITAGLSLVSMLTNEVMLRSTDGIHGISLTMVIGVAITLSILSGLAGLVSILSGPTSQWRQRLNLSDQQRVQLIYVAQAVGAITWLHVFLCKTHWAFVGLRGYWPYIVMGLAFLSVGATEWARRRGDKVLSDTLKNTSLYLPLIPVIGFWFGAASGQFDWLFDQGKVRYEVLLAVGAAYYIAVSAIWKDVAPRIAAVVLGNAALWILLVQQPGWGFIAHPQAWLIPPAVCVLVVVHLYRNRLQPGVASAVRYGATLVIYVSSTADMLLQQIGQNISGPIILIMLALVGMAVGVILRVRPFLYLGAMFVFIGVISMVWHAQVAIDQVWPWWVFGITTGICLLGGLMALEKNKQKLRRYANELSTWQG